MAALTTSSAASVASGITSAGVAAGIATGVPPQDVIIWAFLGSLVAVWLDRQKSEALSWAWVGRAIGMIGVSVLSGIAASAFIEAMEAAPMIGFLAKAPRWVVAFTVAALIHKAGPLAYRVAVGRSKKEGADVAP